MANRHGAEGESPANRIAGIVIAGLALVNACGLAIVAPLLLAPVPSGPSWAQASTGTESAMREEDASFAEDRRRLEASARRYDEMRRTYGYDDCDLEAWIAADDGRPGIEGTASTGRPGKTGG